jgi:hypothetical protein
LINLPLRIELRFIYHGNSLRWADLRTYSASFAVLQIYLDRDSLANYGIWAIEPALKADGLILPGWEALFLVYHWARAAPLTCLTCFSNAR